MLNEVKCLQTNRVLCANIQTPDPGLLVKHQDAFKHKIYTFQGQAKSKNEHQHGIDHADSREMDLDLKLLTRTQGGLNGFSKHTDPW